MSVVIRDALIRLRIELEKSKLDSPEASGLKKAFEDQSKAAKDTARATKDAAGANRSYADSVKTHIGGSGAHWANAASAVRKSNQQILSHMTEGLEGVTRFTRGVALMGVNTEQEMHALLQRLIKLQAGFDIVAGGAKYIKGLGLAFGGAGMAVGGVTLALAAGAIAWQVYQQKLEAAKAAAEQTRRALINLKQAEDSRAVDRNRAMGRERIGAGLEDPTKFARIEEERKRLVSEQTSLQMKVLNSRIGKQLDVAGSEEERKKILRAYGSDRDERDLQGRLQNDLAGNLRAQMDLMKQQAARDKELFERANNQFLGPQIDAINLGAFAGMSGFAGVASAGAGEAMGAGRGALQDEQRRVLDNAQTFIDAFVKLLTEAVQRASEVESIQRELDAANPK